MEYDFCGWATRCGVECADGITIEHGAFNVDDGKRVPLVWNHQHKTIDSLLGYAVLHAVDDGVYAYCSLNDTPSGEKAKKAIKHGDVDALSIWATNLAPGDSETSVKHGTIKEVSLVLAGANPKALVESVIAHGCVLDINEGEDEAIIYTGGDLVLESGDTDHLAHADDDEDSKSKKTENKEDEDEDIDVVSVLRDMSDAQKIAVGEMIRQVVENQNEEKKDDDDDDEDAKKKKEGIGEMKHNIFEGTAGTKKPYLSHSDSAQIWKDAKRLGSLKASIEENLADGGVIAHAFDTAGMTLPEGTAGDYGIHGIDFLFPEAKTLTTEPEFISRKNDWVYKVINGVHRTPFSRVKSILADITEDEARAKGYIKGNLKKEEVFSLLKRTTDPQTVYKKQKIDRDDILDITDLSIVPWIKKEMRLMLDEEVARAILMGDGRLNSSDDKIKEDHIRPIVNEAPLFNTKVVLDTTSVSTTSEAAEIIVDEIIRARRKYKGSGTPILFTTEDILSELLLMKNKIGDRVYKTEQELATALRVSEIVPVEPMEGMTIDTDNETGLPLVGVMVNLSDYNVGTDKGGEISMFDDFDIDYNQQKYLIETRFSGALVKPFSAVTFGLKANSSVTSSIFEATD